MHRFWKILVEINNKIELNSYEPSSFNFVSEIKLEDKEVLNRKKKNYIYFLSKFWFVYNQYFNLVLRKVLMVI